MNKARFLALALISSAGPDSPVRIRPATRIWLVKNLLVRGAGDAQPGVFAPGAPGVKAARFRLTDAGVTVLGIAEPIFSSARSPSSS